MIKNTLFTYQTLGKLLSAPIAVNCMLASHLPTIQPKNSTLIDIQLRQVTGWILKNRAFMGLKKRLVTTMKRS